MPRLAADFKDELLKKANGKLCIIDGYFVIPNGNIINCMSCKQEIGVKGIIVKRPECPLCHSSKVLINGKDLSKIPDIQSRLIPERKPEPEPEPIINNNDKYTTMKDNEIKDMYNDIIANSDSEPKPETETVMIRLLEEMEKRSLWEPEKKTKTKEIDDLEMKLRERLKNKPEPKPETVTGTETKPEPELTQKELEVKIKAQLDSDKANKDKDEKARKRFEMAERLRKKHPDLESTIAMYIAKSESRILSAVTGGEEEYTKDEKSDICFAIELILDKYGIENIAEWLPEIMIIVIHADILIGHAISYGKKQKAKKELAKLQKAEKEFEHANINQAKKVDLL
jgi:hypothetical protein